MEYQDLFYAISEDKGVEELQRFLAEGGDLQQSHPVSGWSLLHCACEHQNLAVIRALVEADRRLLNSRAGRGYPPIFQALDIDIDGAIQTGEPMVFATTRLMLELGADSTLKDHKERTMREVAQIYGDSVVRVFDEIISPLLKA